MRLLLSLALLALPLAAQQEGTFERTLTVTGPVDLQVETPAGRVAVKPGDAATVRIHATIRANNDAGPDAAARIAQIAANPPIQQSGNTVHIGRIEDEALRKNLSISYEIATPAATSLRLRTGAGSVNVEGLQGPVDAASGSGSVTLDSIQGKVNVRTGSGSIHARSVAGPSVLQTGSGSVHLDQTAAGTVKAQTGSGSVEVKLASTSGYELRAHTGSGRVQVEPPITTSGTLSRNEMRGLIRGGGPLVEVSTGSGSVRVE